MGMRMPSRIACILVNWREADRTIRCLESLARSSAVPDTTVVVDNASGDLSAQRIGAWLAASALPGRVLETPANAGFAAACNLAVGSLDPDGFDWYWLLNNDAVIRPDSVEQLRSFLDWTPAGLVGCRIAPMGSPSQAVPSLRHLHRITAAVLPLGAAAPDAAIPYLEGSALAISRRTIQSIGLLEEFYFLYFEEADYCMKARRAGIGLAVAHGCIVLHEVGGTTGSGTGPGRVPAAIDCLQVANRIAFGRRWRFPVTGLVGGLLASLLLRLLRRQPGRALTILLMVLSRRHRARVIRSLTRARPAPRSALPGA